MPSSAPYRMLCIRKMPPDRHHQDRVRRGVRRSQLHSASAEAAKAPYPLAPSSFPNCDRFAGSQFGDTGALPVLHGPLSFLGRLKPFFSFWQRKKRMGSKNSPSRLWRAGNVRPYRERQKRKHPPLGREGDADYSMSWTTSSGGVSSRSGWAMRCLRYLRTVAK